MRFTTSRKNTSGVNRKHLNRRGRHNADGAEANNLPSVFETLEGRTMMSVTTDAQGWSVVNPAADSKVIYVSNSGGSDSNSGLSASSPVKSLDKAQSLLRDNSADQMLLKRGDTWNDSFGTWYKSGRSDDQPMLIGNYGSGALPLLKTGTENGFQTGKNDVNHLFIQGIHLNASSRDAGTSDYRGNPGGNHGIQLLAKSDDITVEGCEIENYRMNIGIQTFFGSISDVTFRRNSIHHAWSTPGSGHSSGAFIQGVNGIQLIENVFDHNGWNEKAPGSAATIFNHGTYMRADNQNVTVIGNVFANASSHGLQARAGGDIKDNLFVNNPIHLSYGLVIGSPLKAGGISGEVEGNVFLGSRDINGSSRGWGIEIANVKKGAGAHVHDNIFAQDSENTSAAIMLEYGRNLDNAGEGTGLHDVTIEDNIVYKWNTGMSFTSGMFGSGGGSMQAYSDLTVRDNDFVEMNGSRFIAHSPSYSPSNEKWTSNNYFDSNGANFTLGGSGNSLSQWKSNIESTATSYNPNFKDPGRNVASYMTSIGGSNSTSAFMSAATGLAYENYKPQYTAKAVISHVRAGYNLTADPTPTPMPDPEPTPTPTPTPTPPPTPTPEPTPTPTPVKNAAPAATLTAADLTQVGKWYEFTVEYKDDNGVDVSTVNGADVRVKGGKIDVGATLKSVKKTATGAIATYAAKTPQESWDYGDNATFTVRVVANQVRDSKGAAVKAADIGTFRVSIAKPNLPASPTDETPAPAPVVTNGRPKVVSTTFVERGGKQKLLIKFSEDVSRSLRLKDLDVFSADNNRVAKYATSLSYDKATNTATVTFKVALREGSWKVSLWCGGIWDAKTDHNLAGNASGLGGAEYNAWFKA